MNIQLGIGYWLLVSALGLGLFVALRRWYANDQYPWRAKAMLMAFFVLIFPLKFVVCVLALLYVLKLLGFSITYYPGSSDRG
ncbi:MAG: hypothetical protein WAV67_09365 [Dokdonella sp.]